MVADFDVNRDPGNGCCDEVVDQIVGSGHHQMRVEGDAGPCRKITDHRRSEGEVWHEVPIHDVEVQQVCTSTLDLGHLVGKARKIGRK
jgi:hypothetical protein